MICCLQSHRVGCGEGTLLGALPVLIAIPTRSSVRHEEKNKMQERTFDQSITSMENPGAHKMSEAESARKKSTMECKCKWVVMIYLLHCLASLTFPTSDQIDQRRVLRRSVLFFSFLGKSLLCAR